MHTNSIIALSHVRMHVGMQAVEGILGVEWSIYSGITFQII